ncbi:MAG: hypothetical protein HC876_10140 [Chloroflexaceae bacterium]|nr:hypothetical protein [Chloroflexaceae bacterium]NJO05842.1 hypothetical protein [Chloroflexaceae bacterium]
MTLEIVKCPTCKQKLGVQPYIQVGSRISCANPGCNTMLLITKRHPIQVEVVPYKETLNADSSPESYG